MNWQSIAFDWNQVRTFLAAAEAGSLSAAARDLASTQPTVSRQVAALEDSLGITLFERGTRGMALTDSGLDLLEHVRAMALAAQQVSLAASGQSQAIDGQVTITATSLLAARVLPPVVAAIKTQAPELELSITASNELRDLRLREADIAIRHAAPNHPELIGRRLGDTRAHLYAERAYLDRVGWPAGPTELSNIELISGSDPTQFIAQLAAQGLEFEASQVKLTTDDGNVLVAMVEQGLGATMLPETTAKANAGLTPVLPDFPAVAIPVWLVTHRELRTSRRIRLAFDAIADGLSPMLA